MALNWKSKKRAVDQGQLNSTKVRRLKKMDRESSRYHEKRGGGAQIPALSASSAQGHQTGNLLRSCGGTVNMT